MAVIRALVIVIMVAVTQVESANIRKPEDVVHNQVDIPESTDHLSNPKDDIHENKVAASTENQVNPKQEDSGKLPDNGEVNSSPTDPVITNSHTITSQDFAEKTGVGGPQVPEVGGSKNPEPPDSHKPNISNDDNENPEPGKENSDEIKPIESTDEDSNAENTNTIDGEQVSDDKTTDAQTHSSDMDKAATGEDENTNPSSSVDDLIDLSLDSLSQTISDEIKVYSNEVAMNWESKKGGASWTLEAESVLKDYVDKISIAQSANNSNCVKKDLENHAARSRILQNIMDSCRSDLKREEWDKLQEKTKSTLNKISEIVQEAGSSIDKLSKDDPNYSTERADIENGAKRKLQRLNSDNLRNRFLKLRDNAMKADENEYINCLDNKPEKGMIVDTLNDIMRIKNNCVG